MSVNTKYLDLIDEVVEAFKGDEILIEKTISKIKDTIKVLIEDDEHGTKRAINELDDVCWELTIWNRKEKNYNLITRVENATNDEEAKYLTKAIAQGE